MAVISKNTSKKSASAPVVPTIEQSPDAATANKRLADHAHRKSQEEKVAAREKSTSSLPPLPRMPKGPRKSKPARPCECGCAEMTKGGRFIPGHDARLHGWALRVERGMLKASEVPAPHTDAVKRLLALKKKEA